MNKKYYTNYQKNQYEDLNRGKFLQGEEVIARYIDQEEATYKNNALIEALPPILTDENTFYAIENSPIYSENERNKNALSRLHAIYRLEDYVLPLPKYFEIENKISISIRRGYVHKKILSINHKNGLRMTSQLINSTEKDIKNYKDVIITSYSNSPQSAGFSIIGMSGAGKSTAVDNILATYPQSIVHTECEDGICLFKQVPWLKIDCSYNGNIKGLCQKFFANVDKALGTNYLQKFGRISFSIDKMIIGIAHVAQIHALGLLVIDEIQHLRCSKQEDETALNFFVSMMNEVKLPILYVGTYKAIEKLSKDFRHARRSTGIGIVELSNMKNDDTWNMFIEDLWQYQWVKNKKKLTQEIKDLMYFHTMGITDRVVKLFMAVQAEAIKSETEEIIVKLIEKVSNEKFALTKKMIDGLRTENKAVLIEYEDLAALDVREIIENAQENIEMSQKLQTLINSDNRRIKQNKKQISDEIYIFLAELNIDLDSVVDIIENVVNKYYKDKDISFIKQKVIIEIHNQNENSKGDLKSQGKATKDKPKKNKPSITFDSSVLAQDIKGQLDGIDFS